MDLLNDLRLRRWARENFVPPEQRPEEWDAVILSEMRLRDAELASIGSLEAFGSKLVPLEPSTYVFDIPHLGPAAPHFLSKPDRRSATVAGEWSCHFG
ncbi:MAG: hypothetical protein M3552_15350 [Planctomycetota bacterium]|nr:hypothetical protein [Planctomycetaceae bacterium]MDQ3332007.1 hypothetical protein [Planctomycetota bacterium]